jgi:hypothetical protein
MGLESVVHPPPLKRYTSHMARPSKTTLLCLLTLLAWAGLAQQTHTVWQSRSAIHESLASDALPIYLAGAAVLDGGDPTQASDLIAAYERRKMGTGALFFSTLYPASVGVMVAPLADRPWVDFLRLWRLLMLMGAGAAGVAGGLAAVRGPRAWLAAPLGGLVVMAGFPLLSQSLGLGQANLLIAGLVGLCMLGLSRGCGSLAGSAAAAGAALKLVPALLFWPMLAGRRWRALASGALVGGALIAWTLSAVSLPVVLSGIEGTVRFQQGVFPDWMNRNPAPDWMIFLGALRGWPMGTLTLGLIGLSCWSSPRQSVLACAGAAGIAWLATDAAAVGVFYSTLLLPALAYAVMWPLVERAPRRAWAAPILAGLPWLLHGPTLSPLADEPRMVLLGLAVWALCMLRLQHTAPTLPRLARWVGAALLLAGLISAGIRTAQGPDLPPLSGDGMETMPRGHGAGIGGVGPDRNWNTQMPERMPGQAHPEPEQPNGQ